MPTLPSSQIKRKHPWVILSMTIILAFYGVVYFAGGDSESYSLINAYVVIGLVISGIIVIGRIFSKRDPKAGIYLLVVSVVTLIAAFVTEYFGAEYYNLYRSTAVMDWAPLILLVSFISACLSFRRFDPKKGMRVRLFLMLMAGFEVLVLLWFMAISMQTII